ncbi:MAG: trypsin-like peptidase domain-containing protein [Oceanospirillaceae bacterium]|nr:trypsin-like peptidase domain-containing protein [Oceanospirillaceae bacterium]
MTKIIVVRWLVVFCVLLSPLAFSTSNIEFLDKETIKSLNKNVFEVVIPKIESDKITYVRELPFHQLNYRERNEKYHSIGTAFFINDKELMSAAHVFKLESFSLYSDIYIRDSEGEVFKVNKVNHYSNIKDVIVFDLETYPETITPLIFTEKSEIGDTVFSIGNAQGEGISFRAGQIASYTPEPEYGKWKEIRFTAPASPGNSGGPLVNIAGDVVGLIVKRNSSENHNIAVPSNEVMVLDDQAVFLHRNLSMFLNVEQNSIYKDWSASFPLPKSVKDLASLAQNSVDEFYGQLLEGLNEKYAALAFPKGERFRVYLRDQKFVKQFGVLKAGPDFKEWFLSSYSTKTKSLEKNQDLKLSKSDVATMHLLIEKTTEVSLNDFLNDPKLVMDSILKGLPLTRAVGKEKVRISSLGAPESVQKWTDKLGRKWTSSLWFMPTDDYFVYSHCVAYPKGALCNLDIQPNSALKYGYLAILQNSYNELAVGYEGKVTDWLELFSLDKDYLSKGFESAGMTLKDGVFKLNIDDYAIQIDDAEITDKSNLHFHFGYSSEVLLAEDLLLFEIFPNSGERFHYRIQKYHSPSEYSDDETLSTWHNIINKKGDFTGEIINKDGQFSVQNVIKSTMYDSKDEPDNQELYVIRCISDRQKEDMKDKCQRFADKVTFTAR